MIRKLLIGLLFMIFSLSFLWAAGTQENGESVSGPDAACLTVTDGLGREIEVPENPEHIICSGPGALRLCSYLGCQDRVVAVDDMETGRPKFDARPYALANPQFKQLPTFGEFRGHDNPELIVALEPQPQVIFKTFPEMGMDPLELETKTGIPVVVLNYGDLFTYKDDFYSSLRTMAEVMDRQERAEEVIDFIEENISDLSDRIADISEVQKKTCYVGGIAFKGPHGFQSTEPTYPPFLFIKARNVAFDPSMETKQLQHSNVAKESIVIWDPKILFLDVSTLQSEPQSSALYELQNDPAYRNLTAVREGRVYGLLPYNWYSFNYGSILANAYYSGSVLFPEAFGDISPRDKANEIYSFLVGEPVFEELNQAFDSMAFANVLR